jgi:hypothetical protein
MRRPPGPGRAADGGPGGRQGKRDRRCRRKTRIEITLQTTRIKPAAAKAACGQIAGRPQTRPETVLKKF